MDSKRKNNVYCCVVGCKNTGFNSPGTEFHCFPTASPLYPHKFARRQNWLVAVQRQDQRGSPWVPNKKTRICSRHFAGNKKSEDPRSPSYNPTIFPDAYRKSSAPAKLSIERYERSVERKKKKSVEHVEKSTEEHNFEASIENTHLLEAGESKENSGSEKLDKNIQVDLPDQNDPRIHQVFICNLYMRDTLCDAETQACSANLELIKVADISKETRDELEPENPNIDCHCNCKLAFKGMESIRTDREMLDLAGVTKNTFQLLLKVLSKDKHHHNLKISPSNRCLIFLIKMKSGLSFSALSVLFNVHRSTIFRIFFSTLTYLAGACRNFVMWPDRETVQATMPNAFKDSYANCRGIIDCTEFEVEQPSTIELRVQFYSQYKKGFRIQVLVCCTPSGLISFISKCHGGRTTDAQITTSSGFFELLEPGDVILADKEFPQIKTVLDESGRGILLVMPPFLYDDTFTAEEVSETDNVASVPIHIERIMQRLRTYKILDKFTIKTLPYWDDIVFMCSVLVNLQSPIFEKGDT